MAAALSRAAIQLAGTGTPRPVEYPIPAHRGEGCIQNTQHRRCPKKYVGKYPNQPHRPVHILQYTVDGLSTAYPKSALNRRSMRLPDRKPTDRPPLTHVQHRTAAAHCRLYCKSSDSFDYTHLIPDYGSGRMYFSSPRQSHQSIAHLPIDPT